jgi:methylmalonyl-CoA mutase, C-terminal domain
VSTPYRVLVAKPGLDSHDRGIRVLATELMRQGFEVIYTGTAAVPESLASTAVDEDVDALCLSMHVGAHVASTRRVIAELERLGAADIPVICGGIIPEADEQVLRDLGAREVVPPMISLAEAVAVIFKQCESHRAHGVIGT